MLEDKSQVCMFKYDGHTHLAIVNSNNRTFNSITEKRIEWFNRDSIKEGIYSINGPYGKDHYSFSKEEREELFNFAKSLYEKGLAKTTKVEELKAKRDQLIKELNHVRDEIKELE